MRITIKIVICRSYIQHHFILDTTSEVLFNDIINYTTLHKNNTKLTVVKLTVVYTRSIIALILNLVLKL